ncbi:MAG: sel1 repeat family protein, partial [Cellvibrionales bacterium]|nr:sel1 repeat family protein [Cellvibrionales bacterium]
RQLTQAAAPILPGNPRSTLSKLTADLSATERTLADLELAAANGDATAQQRLGIHYQAGTGGITPADPAQAYIWLTRANAQYDTDPPAALTTALTTVTAALTGPRRTTLDLQIQAEDGNAQAQFDLGVHYQMGTSGITTDNNQAYLWLSRAAANGHTDSNSPTLLSTVTPLVAADAAVKAALDQQLAAESSIALDRAQAQFDLGILYRDGTGLTANNIQAYIWLTRAGESGHTEREASDYTEVIRLYQLATTAGYAPAQNALGLLNENAEGIDPTIDEMGKTPEQIATEKATARYTEAARLYALAAAADHDNPAPNADAQYNLGSLYARALIPAPTPPETREAAALRLYLAAAAQGHVPAQLALGTLHANGEGVTRDPSQAYLWLSLGIANSQTRGLPCLQTSLRIKLDNGGPTENLQAIRAARNLLPNAPCTVPDIAPRERPIGSNPAAESLRDSMAALISTGQITALDTQVQAMRARPAAQHALGTLHQTGTGGLPQNNEHAYLWLKIAEQNGHTQPADPTSLTTLTGMLTTADLTVLNLELAAARGDATAQLRLGTAYKDADSADTDTHLGSITTADNEQAYYWLTRARANYDTDDD